MVHSQVTRRIDNQSVIINRDGFVFEFLTPSKRIERVDENNSSLLSDIIFIFILVLRSIQYILRLFVFDEKERKKKKSRLLLLLEKLGNKKKRFVILWLERNSGFAYAVANRETSALLFLDIHIPPIPIPIFFSSSFLQIVFARVSPRDILFLMQTSLSISVFKTIFQIIRLALSEFSRLSNSCIILRLSKKINAISISLNSSFR